MSIVTKSTLLYFNSIINQCDEIIKNYKYQNIAYDVLILSADDISMSSNLSGKSLDDFKTHMSHYKSLLKAMKEANEYDTVDCLKVVSLLEEKKKEAYLCGDEIITGRDSAQKEANDYRQNSSECNRKGNEALDPDQATYWYSLALSYSNSAEIAESEMKMYQEKIDRLQEIEDTVSILFTNGQLLRYYIEIGLRELGAAYNSDGSFNGHSDMTWRSDYEERKADDKKKRIEKFYSSLPENVRYSIDEDDIVITEDGFFMINKPMSEILGNKDKANIKDTSLSESSDDVHNYYDDWYIYGIEDSEGNYTYGMLKLREPENDGGDGENAGVTVSFVSFDINKLEAVLEEGEKWNESENGRKKMDEFVDEFEKVILNKSSKHSNALKNYFNKTMSDAPYLIADLYINKVADVAKNPGNYGKIDLHEDFTKNARKGVKDKLKKINKESGKMIYDEKNHCLHIEDPNNPTEYEKLAILIACTGDLSKNSFAAEIEYHADAIDRELIEMLKYDSAIRADMNAFKEKPGLDNLYRKWFEEDYLHLNSDEVTRQSEVHGKE